MNAPLRIGIVGAGTMGSIIARAIDGGRVRAVLAGVADIDPARAAELAAGLRNRCAVRDMAGLTADCDLVVEAASTGAVADLLPEAVERGTDLMVLSVGGLIDQDDWIRRAAERGVRIHCPSGAVAGLDAVKAAAAGGIDEARITTRKPPAGLAGAPYLTERGIDLSAIEQPRVVFDGSAREACRAFPANINVAAALSLAGIGVDRTRVTILADPGARRNVHEIEVAGAFGRLRAITENAPSENPRTSRLAALSAVALLEGLSAPLRIGT